MGSDWAPASNTGIIKSAAFIMMPVCTGDGYLARMLHERFRRLPGGPLGGLPPVVHPEPLLRVPADARLEGVAVRLGQRFHGVGLRPEPVRVDRVGADRVIHEP